jgi:putative Ca2+/H+ antiporter (TMEM165/GDT1 family)
VEAFLLSFAVIFVVELGDKSQLMALTFATRFRALPVLVGIGLATLLVHLGSVVIGAALGSLLPTRPIELLGGPRLPRVCRVDAARRYARRR